MTTRSKAYPHDFDQSYPGNCCTVWTYSSNFPDLSMNQSEVPDWLAYKSSYYNFECIFECDLACTLLRRKKFGNMDRIGQSRVDRLKAMPFREDPANCWKMHCDIKCVNIVESGTNKIFDTALPAAVSVSQLAA